MAASRLSQDQTKLDSHQTPVDYCENLRTWVGVPYEHQGRSREGVDCLGLLVCCARELGMHVVDNLNYGRAPDYKTMKAGLEYHMIKVPFEQWQPGDVLWIKWQRRAYPEHLAVISRMDKDDGWPLVVHAALENKRVVEHRVPKDWKPLIKRVLRWRVWAEA